MKKLLLLFVSPLALFAQGTIYPGGGGGSSGLNAPSTGAPCIIGANSTVSPSATTCSSFIVTTMDKTGTVDSGPALRAALAAGGPGTYIIPKGTFKISTLVTRTRKQPIAGDLPQGTIFNCPGTTGDTCFAIGDSTYGPNNYGMFTDRNYTIVGSGKSNVASTCVYMGGDPSGVITPSGYFADFVNFTNVIVHDCGTGFLTGNNTYINVWDHFSGWNNHYNFYAPVGIGNSGEREVITNSTIFNSDEGIESTASPLQYWEIDNSSFDFAGLAIHGNQLHVHVKNTHFEAQNGVFIQQDFGNAFIDIDGGEFQYDSGSGTEPAVIVINGIYSVINLENLQVNSNHTIPSLINTDNPANTFVHIRSVSMDNAVLAFTNIGASVRGLIEEMGNNTDQAGKGWAFGCDMVAGSLTSFNVCAPLVLPGSTSGSVTVTAPAVAGSTVFAFPGTTGTTGQALVRDSGSGTQWIDLTGTGTVTHTVGALTSGQLIIGNAGSDIKTGNLSGDISTSGSAVATLATVNGNVGTCGDATHTSQITLDAKGRATACTPVLISGASSAFNALTSGTNTTATMHVGTGATLDATGSGSVAATTMPGGGLTGANSVPASTLPLATTGAFGAVKPDGSTITVSAGVISSVGGSGFQSAGLLSARPATCTVGTGIYQYFATDQPIGQQWYYCSATNTWTQFFLNDSTLTNTAGTFGVDLNQFCRFTNSCTVAARWDFSGAASTSPNKKGLASAIPATCTVGDTYFETDATAGQNLYGCTATNTWTLQGGSGSVTTHYGLITNTATSQTIPGTSTATPITFDTNTDLTNSAIHSTSSNQQNFVADATGRWSGACQVTATNNAINFSIVVFINSTAVFNNGGDHTAGAQNVPWSYPLTSGDIVTCQAVSAAGFTVASVGTTFYGYLIH